MNLNFVYQLTPHEFFKRRIKIIFYLYLFQYTNFNLFTVFILILVFKLLQIFKTTLNKFIFHIQWD